MKKDYEKQLKNKSANLTTKFTNFCHINKNCPFDLKIKVLDACIKSSLLYACEVGGNFYSNKWETKYRHAIKTALDVRQSINNEIILLKVENILFWWTSNIYNIDFGIRF